MARPIELPGIIGDLARRWPGGLAAVSEELRIPARSLRQWANNEREPGAIAASRVRDLCEAAEVRPVAYRAPFRPLAVVVSTSDGWVILPDPAAGWETRWDERERFEGSVEELERLTLDVEKVRREAIGARRRDLLDFEVARGGRQVVPDVVPVEAEERPRRIVTGARVVSPDGRAFDVLALGPADGLFPSGRVALVRADRRPREQAQVFRDLGVVKGWRYE